MSPRFHASHEARTISRFCSDIAGSVSPPRKRDASRKPRDPRGSTAERARKPPQIFVSRTLQGTFARMSPFRLVFLLVPTATVALAAVAMASPPAARDSAAAVITPVRVDGVHLGDTHADLLARGKVGPIGPGCELGGPNTRSAKLKAPLKGFVNFTLDSPRKVTDITIRGGATGRDGVGIGSTISQLTAAYPKAKVDHGTDDTFELTLV